MLRALRLVQVIVAAVRDPHSAAELRDGHDAEEDFFLERLKRPAKRRRCADEPGGW